MLQFIQNNIVEIVAAILGLLFIYLEIKENKWLWITGLLTSFFYIYVFFIAKLYADMSLQLYYVAVSVYGWIKWTQNKNKTHNDEKELKISRLKKILAIKLLLITTAIYGIIAYVLVNFTDDPLPYWDSFTTSLSIVATWMLAQKILEQWLVWIVADGVSLCLYVYKELYPTVILFAVYAILAVVGYYQWKNTLLEQTKLEDKLATDKANT